MIDATQMIDMLFCQPKTCIMNDNFSECANLLFPRISTRQLSLTLIWMLIEAMLYNTASVWCTCDAAVFVEMLVSAKNLLE